MYVCVYVYMWVLHIYVQCVYFQGRCSFVYNMYVFVCVCVCVRVCVCMCAYIVYIFMYYMCMYVRMRICMYAYVRMRNTCTYVYVRVCVCACTNMYSGDVKAPCVDFHRGISSGSCQDVCKCDVRDSECVCVCTNMYTKCESTLR
jgi:hypothetical protein